MNTRDYQRLKHMPAYARRASRRTCRLTHQHNTVLPHTSSMARNLRLPHDGFLRRSGRFPA